MYQAAVTITGDKASNLDLCLRPMVFPAVRILLRVTSAATQDLGLHSLIQKNGTHVPQWAREDPGYNRSSTSPCVS
jgi:hypothetical protein